LGPFLQEIGGISSKLVVQYRSLLFYLKVYYYQIVKTLFF